MSYRIAKRWRFEAAHQLAGLPDGHPCARLHGHSYQVEVELAGALDARGFVVDYGDLAPFGRYLAETCDHRLLNDVVPQPTAEHLAAHFYGVAAAHWPQVVAVRVVETRTTWAEYRPC